MTNTNYFTRQNLTKRFTNSLCQHKPSFDFKKNYCQDLLKTQWKIIAEKVWTWLFLGLTLLHMHL